MQKLHSFSCNNHNKQTLKWCWNDAGILLNLSFANDELTRVGNFWFLYPLVLSKWEDLAFSVSRLFEKSVFILQFFNDKMHNYVKQNITKNFNIKKLNNKHTFLKTEKTKFSRWENLAFSVLRKVCLFFNFWIIKHTNALNKT